MAIAKDDVVVDYAQPTLKAERALKDLHNCMLAKKYEEAMAHALEAILETRAAYHAIQRTLVLGK